MRTGSVKNLAMAPGVVPQTLQAVMDHYGVEGAEAILRFLLRCLELDPAKRATAQELLRDSWVSGVEVEDTQ